MPTYVAVIIEVSEECADPGHSMGVTDDANTAMAAQGSSAIGEITDGPVQVQTDSLAKLGIR